MGHELDIKTLAEPGGPVSFQPLSFQSRCSNPSEALLWNKVYYIPCSLFIPITSHVLMGIRVVSWGLSTVDPLWRFPITSFSICIWKWIYQFSSLMLDSRLMPEPTVSPPISVKAMGSTLVSCAGLLSSLYCLYAFVLWLWTYWSSTLHISQQMCCAANMTGMQQCAWQSYCFTNWWGYVFPFILFRYSQLILLMAISPSVRTQRNYRLQA